MNIQFDIDIQDPVIIYTLKGKITSELDSEDFEKEVFNHLNQNYFRIVFNLNELTHTNSIGIGFFMRTLTKARIMGGELVLCNVKGNVEKIFKISKLDEIYTIYSDQTEAINHFK
ncbi:MAG: STAS domain-containing protein [Crocinitomicaceae bacterium]|nr:STAS domain-containing protein [Crocinitomicaceae bacterium]MDG1777516.1 STAS domain-containing protein [Crocinitomicaceae bacterium]